MQRKKGLIRLYQTFAFLMMKMGDKKDIFATFSLGLNCSVPITPKAQEKSYLFFSLFFLISSLEKSRGRVREKWRVKREEWKVQKEKAACATFLFGGDERSWIFATFSLGLKCSVPITPKACISSKRSFVYHQGESLVYHHCERRYSLRLMIYTFGDDIHDCIVMIYHCFRNG